MPNQTFDVPGSVEGVHEISGITAVEYYDGMGIPHFRVFVDNEDTGVSVPNLDTALVFGIAYRYDGEDTEADVYFLRMIGAEVEE